MKFLLALFGFFFLVITAGFAVMIWKVRKRMRAFRRAMEDQLNDDAFQRMADKDYYRKKRNEGPMFDEEYFKGDPNGWRERAKAKEQQQSARRTTHTSAGVTIIDDRDPSKANKKIFSHDEGEYVDFEES